MSRGDRLQVLLKEWELCQDNLKRHTMWLWQTGGIFIALSLAALWGFSQVESRLRIQWFLIFSSFSLLTLMIWYLFIIRRAFSFVEETQEQIKIVENELASLAFINRDLLHTRIQRNVRTKFRARYGVYFFILLVFSIWILTFHILVLS